MTPLFFTESSMHRTFMKESSASKTIFCLFAIVQVLGLCCLCYFLVEEVADFKVLSLPPHMSGWALAGFVLFVSMIPLIAYVTWRDHLRSEDWSARIDEDRSAVYRQHPSAMRLVGASSYLSESFEPIRTIDPIYDVQPRKKIEKQQSELWQLVPLLLFLVLPLCGLLAGGGIVKLVIDWGPLLTLCCFGIGIPMMAYTLYADAQERQPEQKVETNSFAIQFGEKTGFHRYHDRVLIELGFKKLRTCLRGGRGVRFIYLSQAGNLLVELVEFGSGYGKPFFVLATVTNDGKFLETHSLVKPKDEKRDLNMRWQRRSANHQDFVRALAEHDQLVAKVTGGSVQEAQFTEERYERFLRWGAERNAI